MTLKTSVFRALIHRESWIPFWKLSENSEVRFNEHRPSFERIVEEETRERMIEIEDPSIHRWKFFNDRTSQLLSLCFSQFYTHTHGHAKFVSQYPFISFVRNSNHVEARKVVPMRSTISSGRKDTRIFSRRRALFA